MRPNPLIALSFALALQACDRREPEPSPTLPASTPTEGQKVSIIRDDVGIEREASPPLAPLNLVIGFPDGGSDLTEAAENRLREALASKQMAAGGRITLGGHTDSAGVDSANLRAATRRAEAVRDWLVDQGVEASRIEVIAFGEQNPIAPNARPDGTPDDAGRSRNRRVEMTIAVPPGTPPAAIATESETLIDELTDAGED